MDFKNLILLEHPLIKHKLGYLRNQNTSTKVFRELVSELGSLLIYEASQGLPTHKAAVQTWAGEVVVNEISTKSISIVPVMRAGIGMLEGALSIFPNAAVHFLGLFRDENTAQPVVYYDKIKSLPNNNCTFILDPMLATGGTLARTISLLKEKGCSKIVVVSIIAAPEGVRKIFKEHKDVSIYCAELDQRLNKEKFIIPGLGDAGDRIYGT
ncbi:MAG: uracil phosphoribosyltransferase [SAR324 cluster bacterium]|nr:uracil phosphoribosyltransferase [SAR324 cluster bacterium]